jgi:phosphoglycerol geranylgeranyltransferase
MTEIYQNIVASKNHKKKLLAILLDPDKIELSQLNAISEKIKQSPATHVFIGGSHIEHNTIDEIILNLKKYINIPIVLFPGNPSQISNKADAILFLNLISGRNPDYLIEHQVNAVPTLMKTNLEIIPTAYILIESGSKTAVERISNTKPLDRKNSDYIVQTAQAGEFMGNKLIYLEAGSGAKWSVPLSIINKVSQTLKIPIIVGGGIRSLKGIQEAYKNGADLVVIGTAFENDSNFFNL